MNGIHDLGGMTCFGPVRREENEPVFHAAWERRAFALAVSLAERGLFEWQVFQQQLIASVGEAERDDPQHPTRGYYESWLVSLERPLKRKRLVKDYEETP